MNGIGFWMSITRYSARWITLCEEGAEQNSRHAEQLASCERLNIISGARCC
jgi:hypothetical protein